MQHLGSLVVVSHACVLASNQDVYAALARRGEPVELVVPSRWRNEYQPAGFGYQVHDGLEGHVHPVAVLGSGRPQRHVHAARCGPLLRRMTPRVVLIEEEPFSLAAIRWSRAAQRLGVPFGVQVAETLDRELPAVLRAACRGVLGAASFVVARSPAAADLARRWGANGEVAVVPHSVEPEAARSEPTGPFTVAFVGRLVDAKGVGDLLDAVRSMQGAVRLVVAGDGPLAARVAAAGPDVELVGPVAHDRIGEVYARAHVTCVPSRATPGWEEQFGRVLVESLARGVPVIATATGEIPWVLARTGGGDLVPERDPHALAAAIAASAGDPSGRRLLGEQGRAGVRSAFSTDAVADSLAALLEVVSPR